ncbi:MAG: hypothetical protein SCK57_04595 [Bacillota bacterium]|nr:hypothetical protein [Bacillota bacterium]MDW7676920.1 hypothetical protein [Bacillota bacterium]
MKKNLLALMIVVILITLFQGTFSTPSLQLEIYHQTGEGSVELMGVVTEESVVRAYQTLYDQLEFSMNTSFADYPDMAVYHRDGAGTIHHTNVWLYENGEGAMQQMTGDRKSAPLSVEDTLLFKEILQQLPVRSE